MGNTLWQNIKYWAQILLLPIYGLSFLAVRSKKIWVFGSSFGRRFSENPRYLYLYVNQHKKDEIRPIWITHNKRIVTELRKNCLEAYYYHSVKGIWYALRAKMYIFDNYSKDINFWQSGRAVKVNLWHGSGNKKTNHDNEFDYIRHPRNRRERMTTWLRRLSDEKPYHYTLATSPAMAEIFVSAFATDIDHIIIEGYPRNDMLFPKGERDVENVYFEEENEVLRRLDDYHNKGFRLLAYMPTFRESEKKFYDVMDIEKFNDFLKEENYILVTKLHPKSKLRKQFGELDWSHILNVDSEVDVYAFLQEIDLLITDYSSVYSDYMMTKRPVVAFQYDWEEYSKDTRSCYISQDEYMPECKATTMNELMHAIQCVMEDDSCLIDRIKSRDRLFERADGYSAERLFEKIKEVSER